MIKIGNIRNKQVKRIAKNIVIGFYDQITLDFQENKRVVESITNVSSKKMRNKIAGYVTTLYRQVQDGKIQTIEALH